MNDNLVAAIAIKPHGIKGEVKVINLTDSPKILKSITFLWFNNIEYKVESVTQNKEFFNIKLKGINNRNDAELIRGELYVCRTNLSGLAKDRYYIQDLIGLDVYVEKEKIGQITDVLQCKSADVICVSGAPDFMFPFLKNVVLEQTSTHLLLDKDKLAECAVYN